MEDYFHLNLKKFKGEKQPAGSDQPHVASPETGRPAAGPEAGQHPPPLSVSDPLAEASSSDPYNSTGRLNSKEFSG